MSREYSSPLRQEQAELTKKKILEAIAAILAENGASELTVAEAARRAGVSVRTAYAYFPTRDALFDGFNLWLAEQVSWSKLPETAEDIPVQVEKFFKGIGEKQLAMYRAARMSKAGVEIREHRKATQVKALSKALESATAHLDRAEARRVAAVIHGLVSSDLFIGLHDHWDLSNEEAAKAARWAIETLLADVKKRRKK
jgi:AcrR family transcriptional regulator